MNSLTFQDLVKGTDFTGLTAGDDTDLNQLVDLAFPKAGATSYVGIGMIIATKDTAANTPDVPNPEQSADYNKWRRYVWLRLPFLGAASQRPILYAWNPNVANTDVTLLNWFDTSADLTALNAAIAQAQLDATDALNTATLANTTANTAATTATAAQTLATQANTNASAAQTASTQASADATAASAAASNATAAASTATSAATNAAAAANAAATAVLTYRQRREFKYTIAGSYNWLCPAGINSVNVICLGAGGGGGIRGGGDAGGGGSGELSFKTVPTTPGTVYSVHVGAKGVGNLNADGSDGGNSYFLDATTILANGGKGGKNGGAAGAGGTGGIGDTHYDGYVGHMTNEGTGLNGFGADSPFDGLGGTCDTAVSQNGQPASGNGAGGGTATGGGNTGGNGSDGLVIIYF